jgi:hypothetical protein
MSNFTVLTTKTSASILKRLLKVNHLLAAVYTEIEGDVAPKAKRVSKPRAAKREPKPEAVEAPVKRRGRPPKVVAVSADAGEL